MDSKAQAQTESLIASYYARFNAGDLKGMLSLLDEEVHHDINQNGSEHGMEAFREFLDRMAEHYQEQIHDIVIMVNADGQRAACEYKVTGTYLKADPGLPPAHGQRYTIPGGAFFSIRNGRISRVTNYYNLQEWLLAVGAAK
jgi:steroid delta-isomerase-like uncharacterized protein